MAYLIKGAKQHFNAYFPLKVENCLYYNSRYIQLGADI